AHEFRIGTPMAPVRVLARAWRAGAGSTAAEDRGFCPPGSRFFASAASIACTTLLPTPVFLRASKLRAETSQLTSLAERAPMKRSSDKPLVTLAHIIVAHWGLGGLRHVSRCERESEGQKHSSKDRFSHRC